MSVIRKLFSFMTLGFILLGMAGCGNVATPPPPTHTALPPSATHTPIPPTITPNPTATNTPFVPKATLKIAVHVPMTGGMGMFGTDVFHASELAVSQLSGPLQLMGYDVELISYDDKGDLDTAIANAKELVNDPDILCGVGHFTSRLTIQTAEVYHKAGLAFVSPSATSPEVTKKGYLEVNRISGRDDEQGTAGARFAQERGFKSIYLLYNTDPYGQSTAKSFKLEAGKLGLNIVGELSTGDSGGFGDTINRILETGADLVYYVGYVDQVGNFINEARAAGYNGAIFGPDSLGAPDIVNLAGPFAIDGGGLFYTATGANTASLPDVTKFAQDYQKQFGVEPQMYASYAYDATGICMKSIEEASKARNGEIPTRAEVAQSIRALVDYPGITGVYNFNANGDQAISTYQILQAVTIDTDKWGANPVVATYQVAPPE